MASKRDGSILQFFAKGKCTKCIIFSAVSGGDRQFIRGPTPEDDAVCQLVV